MNWPNLPKTLPLRRGGVVVGQVENIRIQGQKMVGDLKFDDSEVGRLAAELAGVPEAQVDVIKSFSVSESGSGFDLID